ncbi:dethiobiotin synthase [Luteococcus sanguinis]|uniref:ATP-dependent dethiobiotin synthetase BioD n=1 Tax=Luteococcus sanguinis TaxID=174038 RepID=A0ABW1X575_9ACTN
MTTKLPVTSGIVIITGTDTDVGKSIVTAELTRQLLTDGTDLVVVKPTQTGLEPGEEGDVQLVGRLSGLAPERCLEFVRLPEPLAPTTAARRAGVTLAPMADVARDLAALAREHQLVLVEGAGGVTVGLDGVGDGLLELADALTTLGTPPVFVVVARPGLGTLNHSRLTCDAITTRGHAVAGLVVGSWPGVAGVAPDLAESCNIAELADFTGVPLLGALRAGSGASPEALASSWLDPEETR